MSTLVQKLAVLFPDAPNGSYFVRLDTLGEEYIFAFNPALGDEPTQKQLDEVTDQQIADAEEAIKQKAEQQRKQDTAAKLSDPTTEQAKATNAQNAALLTALNRCEVLLGLKPTTLDEIHTATLDAIAADVKPADVIGVTPINP